jgi:hypothetical protein
MVVFKKLEEWDIWINVHIFKGNKGETISSRLGRYIENKSKPVRGWMARIFCRTVLLPLCLILDNSWKHCRENIQKKYQR